MSLLRFDGDGHKSLFRYLYAKHFDEDHPEYGLGSPLHYSIDEVCQMTLDAVLENDRKLLEKTKDVPVVTSTVSGNAQELLVETESHDS